MKYSVFFILCTRTARGTCKNSTDTRKKEKVLLLIIKLDTCGVVLIPSVSKIIKSAAIKLSPLGYRESLQCVLLGMGVDVTTWRWTVFSLGVKTQDVQLSAHTWLSGKGYKSIR